LTSIIVKIDIKLIKLVKKKGFGLEISKAKEMSDHEMIEAMVLNPILFERPVVINGNNAIIARPINNVNEII